MSIFGSHRVRHNPTRTGSTQESGAPGPTQGSGDDGKATPRPGILRRTAGFLGLGPRGSQPSPPQPPAPSQQGPSSRFLAIARKEGQRHVRARNLDRKIADVTERARKLGVVTPASTFLPTEKQALESRRLDLEARVAGLTKSSSAAGPAQPGTTADPIDALEQRLQALDRQILELRKRRT